MNLKDSDFSDLLKLLLECSSYGKVLNWKTSIFKEFKSLEFWIEGEFNKELIDDHIRSLFQMKEFKFKDDFRVPDEEDIKETLFDIFENYYCLT